jgi:glutathione S-transferase
MSDEIVFYHNPRSRSATVHWMLEEVGADYRVVPVAFGAERDPELLRVNPMGKIPAITHRGSTVTETPAILAYLADLHPEARLGPALGTPERGAWYRWLFFGVGAYEPAVIDAMMKRDAVDKRTAGWGDLDDVLSTLRSALDGRDYLVGDSFSAADLYIAAELGWTGMFGAPGVKGDPVFDAYVARCQDRDAWRRANAQA